MPQFDRYRRIWIYLPPNYDQTTITYPVLYIHDGQNLFDAYTAFAGEWEVDETLNELAAEGKNVPIVVGIDNGGGHRLDEYSAWVNAQYGGGEGDSYIRFIAETLKPYIDEHYRTRTDAYHTGIMGSSLGGFISQYAVLRYPEVFSKGGLFSPSYWYSDSVWAFTESNGNFNSQKLYQIVGSEEGGTMTSDMNEMHELLLNKGFPNTHLFSKVVQGQGHNEAFWRSEFREAYLWMFDDFASGVEEGLNVKSPLIYPNPVKDQLYLEFESIDSLRVFNSQGKVVLEESVFSRSSIQTKDLKAGLYFIEIWMDGASFTSKFVKL
jgi:alpha-glucosidase